MKIRHIGEAIRASSKGGLKNEMELSKLDAGFEKAFGTGKAPEFFSAPGRTEIGGNHTDHQHGHVLAAAVNLAAYAAAAKNGLGTIRVVSEGYPRCEMGLNGLTVIRDDEKNTTPALIRGVASEFAEAGYTVGGFDAYVCSEVLPGSGLSSSAAFEMLLGVIINEIFNAGSADAITIAQLGKRAENVYFGKPCGLMDQAASAVGGLAAMDFADPERPIVQKINYDFAKSGHSLCIVDCGAGHGELTEEYAAIPAEMKTVAAMFGKDVLLEVPKNDFMKMLPEVRQSCGDRAVLRAMHFYGDNYRAAAEAYALQDGDFETFLRLVNESGLSSWQYLQNVVPTGATRHQEVALALALCSEMLRGRGALRIHGGGFAGTVQAFVPDDLLEEFRYGIERVFGAGACRVLNVREEGGMKL